MIITPIRDLTTCRYRGGFTPSGAKDDMPDTRLHLELVRRHRDRLRLMRPTAGADRRGELLNCGRRKLVDMRTDLCNTLRSTLKGYYPLALEAGENWAPRSTASSCSSTIVSQPTPLRTPSWSDALHAMPEDISPRHLLVGMGRGEFLNYVNAGCPQRRSSGEHARHPAA